MSQTVIGVFENEKDAHHAFNDLIENNFSRENIVLSFNKSSLPPPNKKDGIGRFFRSILGTEEVHNYDPVAKKGGAVITVRAENMRNAELAQEILDDSGAVNMDERFSAVTLTTELFDEDVQDPSLRGSAIPQSSSVSEDVLRDREAYKAGTINYNGIDNQISEEERARLVNNEESNKPFQDNEQAKLFAKSESHVIPIIKEEIEVGKKEIQTGETRLRSRIIEREFEENLRLRSESVRVERNAIDRAASESDFTAFKEGNIAFTEKTEVPVITKEARVIEEISLAKRFDERDETVRGTVRHTEVDIEKIPYNDKNLDSQ